MSSRELGLVIAQRLFDMQDLHYGFWDDDLPVSVHNVGIAQQRYTDLLLDTLPDAESETGPVRVLDIGCGSGHMMQQLIARGYACDGVVPAPDLAQLARDRIAPLAESDSRIFECKLEDLPEDHCRNQYDVCLFSESFQYVSMEVAIRKLTRLVKPGGLVVICDFFKSPNHGDGQAGDKSMSGGKRLETFYHLMGRSPFEIKRDDDITRFLSPNLDLVNDLLLNRIAPTVDAIERYLVGRFPKTGWLALRLFKRPIELGKKKYLAGTRSREVFERYKVYRLIVLEHTAPADAGSLERRAVVAGAGVE